MTNRTISRTTEVKEGRTYKPVYTDTNPATVYEDLSRQLVNKKLCNCSYIKSIKRRPNYDGTQTITIAYDNDTRDIFVVKN